VCVDMFRVEKNDGKNNVVFQKASSELCSNKNRMRRRGRSDELYNDIPEYRTTKHHTNSQKMIGMVFGWRTF